MIESICLIKMAPEGLIHCFETQNGEDHQHGLALCGLPYQKVAEMEDDLDANMCEECLVKMMEAGLLSWSEGPEEVN